MNKICTSIEQSQKLIKLEIDVNTADMFYCNGHVSVLQSSDFITVNSRMREIYPEAENYVPAWSLTALIEVSPLEVETHKQTDGNKIYYYVESYMKRMGKEIYLSTERHENLVDACYEMIIKLHEQNII